MSFNPNIPQGTDPILISSFQIKGNFQAINNAFSSNHAALNGDPDLAGNHTALTMRPQSTDPTTVSDQVALYNKLVNSVPQLFFAPNNAQTPIQLTYASIKADSSNTQYSFIAGPFIVYGGLIKNVTQNQLVILTPGTNLLFVELTAANISKTFNFNSKTAGIAAPIAINVTGTSFNIYNQPLSQGSYDAYYFAIGI